MTSSMPAPSVVTRVILPAVGPITPLLECCGESLLHSCRRRVPPRHGSAGQDDHVAPLPTRADFPVRRPMQTRWADDDVYGHANNVVYYAWFDTTVNGWLMEATGTD